MLLTGSSLNQLTGLQVSVCVSVYVCVAFLFRLSSLPYQPLGCSGSVDDFPSCISPIALPQITQNAVLWGSTVDYRPLTLTCVLSPDPSPYQQRTHSSWDSHVDTPSHSKPDNKNILPCLFLPCISWSRGARKCMHTPTHKQMVFSEFKHTVFTLADPSGSTSYIVNRPVLFTRGTSCMITSHTYSTLRPHFWSGVSLHREMPWWCYVASRASTSHLSPTCSYV